jgi:putative N-acetyltransferase (TIGR04045 family)
MPFLDGNSLKIGSSPSSAPAAFTPSVRLGIGVDAEDFRLSPTTHSGHFSFHLLQTTSPLMQGYWQLRRTIFCQEQHLFEEHDRDDRDDRAYPIAAIHPGASQFFGVVGVVRILEEKAGIWYGGRLGVNDSYRRQNQIGKGLIWKAVTTAHGWGAQRLLATVQLQNVRFFERLHWHSLESMDIRGVRHHLMEADLAYYQPVSQRRPGLMAA